MRPQEQRRKKAQVEYYRRIIELMGDSDLFTTKQYLAKGEKTYVSERDKNLFYDYYFTDDSIDMLASKYDVSRDRVRQIIVNLEAKLSSTLASIQAACRKVKIYDETKGTI